MQAPRESSDAADISDVGDDGSPPESGGDGTSAAAWIIGFGAGGVILALMLFSYMIGFNRGEDEGRKEAEAGAPPAAETRTVPSDSGDGGAPAGETGAGGQEAGDDAARTLFVDQCGSCHVLAAAETEGAIGPDLDQLAADEARVLAAIENGGTGAGQMPAGLLSGQEAQDVAAYTAAATSP